MMDRDDLLDNIENLEGIDADEANPQVVELLLEYIDDDEITEAVSEFVGD